MFFFLLPSYIYIYICVCVWSCGWVCLRVYVYLCVCVLEYYFEKNYSTPKFLFTYHLIISYVNC